MIFNHEKLEVYQVSIELLTLLFQLMPKIPPGYGFLTEQLRRASLSIPLNIAEGNAKFGKKEKGRFFGIARASANECGAILDVANAAQIWEQQEILKARKLLYRIVCMLSKMIV
jgi:four helix bundle protein